MTQKDPGGDVIEDIEGQRLIDMIEESGSMAVYFCKCDVPPSKPYHGYLFYLFVIFNWPTMRKLLFLLAGRKN